MPTFYQFINEAKKEYTIKYLDNNKNFISGYSDKYSSSGQAFTKSKENAPNKTKYIQIYIHKSKTSNSLINTIEL